MKVEERKLAIEDELIALKKQQMNKALIETDIGKTYIYFSRDLPLHPFGPNMENS